MKGSGFDTRWFGLIRWEIPRLCRGGSKSSTDPGVYWDRYPVGSVFSVKLFPPFKKHQPSESASESISQSGVAIGL